MESMDCDSDPDVASPDSPMQHSGWESCQSVVSYINTIAAFRKSPASTTAAHKSIVPQTVAMVTQDNHDNQFHPNLQTPKSNWSKCRNVFSAMNSFSGFRAQEALSPKESEKSMEGFSDGDDDGQITMVTNAAPRFQERSEIGNSVNPFSVGNMSGSMTSFFEGLISKTSTDKSEPVINTGIIGHITGLGNEVDTENYSSASHRLSKRHSVPFQSPARSSPTRRSLEPKGNRKVKHHSQPPPKMPRLSENVQEGHRSSPLRSLCKPATKQRKLCNHTTPTDSNPPSKSPRVTFKSFIVFNIFVGLCLSVYALKVIQSTCSTFADFDVNDLKRDLRSKVYGQHLATEIIPDLIDRYLSEMHTQSSWKPLVISLHGWTGVGKNYVSKIVSDFFPYTTINKLLVPLHFAHGSQDDIYAQQIPEWIETNITRCCINFVIFDEMDKASDGVLKGLNESVNMIVNQNATDTPVIFLLLSNSKGADINKHVFQLVSAGRHRDGITIEDFSDVFQTEKLLPQKVIDAFVPFLPLERHHTVQCIKRDIVQKGLNIDKKAVSDVVQEMSFFKLNSGKEFSHTGCKRVSDKVDLIYSAFDENN